MSLLGLWHAVEYSVIFNIFHRLSLWILSKAFSKSMMSLPFSTLFDNISQYENLVSTAFSLLESSLIFPKCAVDGSWNPLDHDFRHYFACIDRSVILLQLLQSNNAPILATLTMTPLLQTLDLYNSITPDVCKNWIWNICCQFHINFEKFCIFGTCKT